MARERGAVLVGIKHTVRGEWGAGVVSGREWCVCVCVRDYCFGTHTTFNLT